MRPGSQLGERDRGYGSRVGERSGDGWIVPVDDDGGIKQSGHLQPLFDCAIEIEAELLGIDMWPGSGERHKFRLRDETPAHPLDRSQLGNRNTVASHDETLACGDSVDDPRVVVAQLALGDRSCHDQNVA